MVRNPPTVQEIWVRSLGREDSLEKKMGWILGNPSQYSGLENPMDRGAWRAIVHGVAGSQTWLKWLSTQASLEKQRPRKSQASVKVTALERMKTWETQVQSRWGWVTMSSPGRDSGHLYRAGCQEAFNRRLPVCCVGSVVNPLFLINSWIFRN